MSDSRSSTPFGRFLRLWIIIAFAVLAVQAPASLAQTPVSQATPVGEGGEGDGPHPAHIHSGTCDNLGDVIAPLEDIASEAGGERVGPESAHPVKFSRSVIDMPLEEIVAGEHAINVHLSADEIGTYIACGDIGGELVTDEDGRTHLLIGLGELNESGHTGMAWIGADGDETEVTVLLIEPDELDS